jgi:fatty acyl-CoA reductase
MVLFRPSIVSPSEKEPKEGAPDSSLSGTMALLFAYTSGLCRTLHCYEDSGLDLIPIDICVKGIIVAAWKKWKDLRVDNKKK